MWRELCSIVNKIIVYISFLVAVVFTSCTVEEQIPQPTSNVNQETLKQYQGKGYRVLTWKTYDYVTEECWDWLDSREKDSIYLCFGEDRIDFAEVEVDSIPYYGYRSFQLDLKDQDLICVYLDHWTKMKVIEISDSVIVMEGKHTLHQQLQRVTIEVEPHNLPDKVKIKFSK